MTTQKKSKLKRLIGRYKKVILLWLFTAIALIIGSILIHYYYEPQENDIAKIIADLFMTLGQAIIGVGLIGGGVGGVINFIFEEFKNEQDELKERLKERQENREKRKHFRNKMQAILQDTHDDVELARVLIKSHKSGRTYGEQIRNRIIPGMITLKDFKRRLALASDPQLEQHLAALQVSLTYMIAYLSVLKEEFEANYLKISNLQNYKEAVVDKLKDEFVDTKENAEAIFDIKEVPARINVVWEALEELDYLKDFISDLRNEEGKKSMYSQYFLHHYYHCNKIIKSNDSDVNKKIVSRPQFVANIKELERIEEKKNSDTPLTLKDSLTRKIMVDELGFDFEQNKKQTND